MASVFKKTSFRPLPDGASVRKRGKTYFAEWSSDGKAYRQPVRMRDDGTARIVYESSAYYFRYTDVVTGRRILVNSGCQVKAMAERVKKDYEDEQERIRAGVIKPEQVKAAGKSRQKLKDVLELYCTYQRGKRKTEKHIRETKNVILLVADYNGWETIGDMNRMDAEKYLESRLADGISFRTHNKNRTALVAFGTWCSHKKHLLNNPFENIMRLDEDADRRYQRRALTVEEVKAIIDAARMRPFEESAKMNRTGEITTDAEYNTAFWRGWNRAMCYRLMACTGLRWKECRTLVFADLHIDDVPPHIQLKARNAKARKSARIPLNDDILPELIEFIRERKKSLTGDSSASILSFPGTFDNKPVFDLPVSISAIFQDDCNHAIIKRTDEHGNDITLPVEVTDASGRRIDVHSLRHFYGTELAKAGVPVYRLKELMRHSTIELSSKYYIHVHTNELQSDVNLLPSTMKDQQKIAVAADGENTDFSFRTHSAQNSCADVHNGAFSCNSDNNTGTTENPVNIGVLTNKHGDMGKKEMVPRDRIELSTRGFSVRNDSNQNGHGSSMLDENGESVRTYSAQNTKLDVILSVIRNLPDDDKTALMNMLK